jgi:peptide/nickel transport system permease protein
MGFGGYLVRRLLLVVPTLVGVTVISFALTNLLPGNPALVKAGALATPEVVQEIERQMGLDRPLPVQYWRYVSGLLRGDLGESASTGRPFFYLLGVAPPPLGRLAADVSPPPRLTGLYVLDAALTGSGAALVSALHHLMLPALTLGFAVMAPLTRMVRATMLEILESDYVKAAWAAGLPRRRVVYGDALRNALIPVITVLGVIFGFLMAGNVVVEMVYAWPGLGHYAVTALVTKDPGPIQSFVLFVAVMYVFVNLAVDLLYGLADPRIRLR